MSQNGLPSKSKKRSPGEGSGRSAKPASGCGWRRTNFCFAVLVRPELELGLLAVLRPAVRVDAGRHGLGRRAPELGERRDPGRGELLDLAPVDAGDAAQVVDVVPPLVAERLEVADAAVVDRIRLGLRRVGDEALEPRAHVPVVGSEVAGVEAGLLPRAEQDVDLLRLAPLDPRELLVVEEELEDVGGLRAAGELRVERLVGAVRLAEEEVGDAAPPVAHEDALVDDVDPAPHRLDRALLCRLEVELVELDLGDRLALGAERLEVGALVLEPLAEDQITLFVWDLGSLDLPTRCAERKRRQMLAGKEAP